MTQASFEPNNSGSLSTKNIHLYKVSTPGSLMLFGEHAVLNNKHALVAAIDKRIEATLIPRKDRIIKINSENYGSVQLSLDKFLIHKDFKFVTAAVESKLPKIHLGFNLNIRSDFTHTLGLGSSAAVTVATLAVLELWLTKKKYNPKLLCLDARKIVRKVQGKASGADVVASVFGGVVLYKSSPFQIKKISNFIPLTVVYSGSKTLTSVVIKKVEHFKQKYPKCCTELFNAIETCTLVAKKALGQRNWSQLGELMNIHYGLQVALGVSNETLSNLINLLQLDKNILGAKISGAGLGDCVIGVGRTTKKLEASKIDTNVTSKGIIYATRSVSKKA